MITHDDIHKAQIALHRRACSGFALGLLKWLPISGFATWDEGKTWFKVENNAEIRITPEELLTIYKSTLK